MKYAITGPAGRIFKVLDAPNGQTKEITDEQAATVNSSELPLFLIDGELKTQEEARAAKQAEQKAAREAARLAAMTPEQLAAEQARAAAKAAYDAAKAVFDALPIGKQALWEPVRQKVAAAILSGDMAKAKEILETVPALYPEAEADRALFLALFPE